MATALHGAQSTSLWATSRVRTARCSAISLAFLAHFDCQDRAGWLSQKRLAA